MPGATARLIAPLRYLATRFPRLAALLFGVILLLVFLAAIEAVSALLLLARATPPWEYDSSYMAEHPVLGLAARENQEVRVRKQRAGETAFDVTYRIDAHGRRVTPLSGDAARPRFALFLGDSFTFGEGVEDQETLPAQFGALAPGFQPYNYGFGGYGPQSVYLQLRETNLPAQIEQESGVAIYTYIDSHLLRLSGSMRILNTWGGWLPHLRKENGTLAHRGHFQDSPTRAQRFASLLWRSPTVRLLQIDWPPVRKNDLDLLAQVLLACRAQVNAQFEDTEFYVLLYPRHAGIPSLRSTLEDAGIKYIDLDGLLPETSPDHPTARYWLLDDHPTAHTHRLVAASLAAYLQDRP